MTIPAETTTNLSASRALLNAPIKGVWGWKRLAHLTRLALSSIRYGSRWSGWEDRAIRALDPSEVQGLADIDIFTLGGRVRFIGSAAMSSWSLDQIASLTSQQIGALMPQQLCALVAAPAIDATEFARIITALADSAHCYKIGEILNVLSDDALGGEKLDIIVRTALSLSDHCLRCMLMIVGQIADSPQLAAFVHGIPFDRLYNLFLTDRYKPYEGEYQRLSTEVEAREFEINVEEQHLQIQVIEFERIRRLLSLEPIIAILKVVQGHNGVDETVLMPRLGAILNNASYVLGQVAATIDIPEEMRKALTDTIGRGNGGRSLRHSIDDLLAFVEQLSAIENQLLFRLRCLQELKLIPHSFVGHWKDQYLPRAYGDIGYNGGKVVDTTDAVVLRRYGKLFARAKRDEAFLIESFSWFSDKIRQTTKRGKFSMEFFHRLVVYHLDNPHSRLLTSRQLEQIVLLPGMEDTLSLIELQGRIKKIKENIAIINDGRAGVSGRQDSQDEGRMRAG